MLFIPSIRAHPNAVATAIGWRTKLSRESTMVLCLMHLLSLNFSPLSCRFYEMEREKAYGAVLLLHGCVESASQCLELEPSVHYFFFFTIL